jgi:predicted cupin superfamily sugar epimerase
MDHLVSKYDMKPHPEGGFFKEIYRSSFKIKNERGFERNCSTSIYYLLGINDFSKFHRLSEDEIWHHYEGDDVEVHFIDAESGKHTINIVGRADKGSHQLVIPKNTWFASRPVQQNVQFGYVLVGCTVSPGFDFADFEMPTREYLLKLFPQHRDIITQLTRI